MQTHCAVSVYEAVYMIKNVKHYEKVFDFRLTSLFAAHRLYGDVYSVVSSLFSISSSFFLIFSPLNNICKMCSSTRLAC